jgi:hypothetical protein
VVYPGPVRTDFLASGSLVVARKSIDAYTEAKKSLDLHQNDLDGKQPGDPDKVAHLLIDAFEAPEPPLHLFAGKTANQLGNEKIAGIRKDLEAWKDASAATDFPDGQ